MKKVEEISEAVNGKPVSPFSALRCQKKFENLRNKKTSEDFATKFQILLQYHVICIKILSEIILVVILITVIERFYFLHFHLVVV